MLPPVQDLEPNLRCSYTDGLSLLGGVKGLLADSPTPPPLTPHCATSDQALTSAAEPCDRWPVGQWITDAPMELDHF
jgi:hypothetical protein